MGLGYSSSGSGLGLGLGPGLAWRSLPAGRPSWTSCKEIDRVMEDERTENSE